MCFVKHLYKTILEASYLHACFLNFGGVELFKGVFS